MFKPGPKSIEHKYTLHNVDW